MYLYTPVVGNYYSVTGCLTFTFTERKIEPRFLADIAVGSGIGEANVGTIGFYPNPASDVIRLDLGAINGRVEYTLVDASGRVAKSGSLTNNPASGAGQAVLAVDELTNGLYTLTLRNNEGVRQARVLVQH